MCGLFGMIRRTNTDPAPASRMCVQLGHLAVERGRDAAGIAMTTGGPVTPVAIASPAHQDNAQGGWRIIKDLRPFDQMWRPHQSPPLNQATVVLGHTRYPTQGRTAQLVNTSPLSVGQIIGTHNGDIDVAVLHEHYTLPPTTGQTDTEVLFQAVGAKAGAIAPTLDVLRHAIGRAALVWADRRHPNLIWLARTAVSPLAIALDEDRTLYWASNPGWFATAAQAARVRLAPQNVWLIPEGTLAVADFSTGRARLAGRYTFTATTRPLDELLLDDVAHLGFSTAHRQADRRLARHQTRPGPDNRSQQSPDGRMGVER